jgi:hypothetical protein
LRHLHNLRKPPEIRLFKVLSMSDGCGRSAGLMRRLEPGASTSQLPKGGGAGKRTELPAKEPDRKTYQDCQRAHELILS